MEQAAIIDMSKRSFRLHGAGPGGLRRETVPGDVPLLPLGAAILPAGHGGVKRLMTIPGIGPACAMAALALAPSMARSPAAAGPRCPGIGGSR